MKKKSPASTIAEPLLFLTNKGITYTWTPECQKAFTELQHRLQSSPILTCPDFSIEFTLYTDASDSGLGAVLQQNNQVVAYASRTLNRAEKQYSVIEKECLALVYAVKQFRHYLLGKHFTIFTDHNPLVWLSSQKTLGKLIRWALFLQEYDFTIKYRKGSSNQNADALSRVNTNDFQHCNITELQVGHSIAKLEEQQSKDPIISQIIYYLHNNSLPQKPMPFKRWLQIWSQLQIKDGILYRVSRSPGHECSTLIVVPASLCQYYLQQFHDSVSAGHQGFHKTLDRLRQVVYWVGMSSDVQKYCESCDIYQRSKPCLSTHIPLVNVPIGKPWEMVAVDILKVPPSFQGNAYLLVLQDYFTKMVRGYTPERPKSGHSCRGTCQSVLSLWYAEVSPLRPGHKFQEHVIEENMYCIWNHQNSHNTLSSSRRWYGRDK